MSKTTTLLMITLYCTFPCHHCMTPTWKFLMSHFVENINTRKRLYFPFSEVWYSPLEFNFRKICHSLTNETRWNKSIKVWSSTNSLFKWHFCRHCYKNITTTTSPLLFKLHNYCNNCTMWKVVSQNFFSTKVRWSQDTCSCSYFVTTNIIRTSLLTIANDALFSFFSMCWTCHSWKQPKVATKT